MPAMMMVAAAQQENSLDAHALLADEQTAIEVEFINPS